MTRSSLERETGGRGMAHEKHDRRRYVHGYHERLRRRRERTGERTSRDDDADRSGGTDSVIDLVVFVVVVVRYEGGNTHYFSYNIERTYDCSVSVFDTGKLVYRIVRIAIRKDEQTPKATRGTEHK